MPTRDSKLHDELMVELESLHELKKTLRPGRDKNTIGVVEKRIRHVESLLQLKKTLEVDE